MRVGMVLVAAAAALAGCTSTPPPAAIATPPDRPLTPVEGGFQPGEMFDGSIRSGTIGAFDYRYTPGRGGAITRVNETSPNAVALWSVPCERDAISDRVSCSLYQIGGALFLFYESAGPPSICAFGHDFPGRRAAIRVDSTDARTTNTDGCIEGSQALYQQLLGGERATIRYYEWPYDVARDAFMSLEGFLEAAEFARYLMGQVGDVTK